jgi:hypothetical protein
MKNITLLRHVDHNSSQAKEEKALADIANGKLDAAVWEKIETDSAIYALDMFIDNRINMPQEIKALSDYGILMFPGFWIRAQKVIANLVIHHPLNAGTGLLARSKAARAAQGYDDKPPRCGECVSFVPCGHKRGGRWQPPTCAIGGFAVQSFGICDRWQGANGDTLEK